MQLNSYFSLMLKMKEGEKIMIPCESKNEQASVKTRLFRMRSKYAKLDRDIIDNLGIYLASFDDKLFVVAEMQREATEAIKVKSDGSIEQVRFKVNQSDSSLQRIISKMIADGLFTEEITQALEGVFTLKEILDELIKQHPVDEGDNDGERERESNRLTGTQEEDGQSDSRGDDRSL